jgi:hypothetical protein
MRSKHKRYTNAIALVGGVRMKVHLVRFIRVGQYGRERWIVRLPCGDEPSAEVIVSLRSSKLSVRDVKEVRRNPSMHSPQEWARLLMCSVSAIEDVIAHRTWCGIKGFS